ncbi:AAA family ATPase [Paenibacillus sp. TRM 82003]|nr:AAA family ATPase [Paenibacillus sp. TRM 82003]
MITKISKIKNFGIYKNFAWGSLDSFAEKNIIYGWNYSGKTTLSRVLSSLRDKKVHGNFVNASFNITYDEGQQTQEVNETNIANFPINVRVFNSDYIKENLKWEVSKELNGIAFDVGENVGLRQEIEKNHEKIKRIFGTAEKRGLINKYQAPIDEFTRIDGKISEEARRIKNDVFNSMIEFTRSHFLKVVGKVRSNIASHIVADVSELTRIKKGSTAINNKSQITQLDFDFSLHHLYAETRELLLSEPQRVEVITVLEENPEMYRWVQQAVLLHNGRNRCSFCDQPISEDRIQKLGAYYSNAAAKLRVKVESCKSSLIREVEKVNNFKIPLSKHDFIEGCQDDYQIQLERLEKVKSNYVNYVNELMELLETKIRENLFVSVEINEINQGVVNNFQNWISTTNKIIDAHNEIITNFEKNQIDCREKIKNHYVAEFLSQTNYMVVEENKQKCERRLVKLNNIADRLQQKNGELEAQLKSVVAGRSKINQFISVFLNRDDISVDVTSNDMFILKRGHEIAENLSEGEKTAISFSYFLVSLESLGIDSLRQTIIFIDDPISSLDSNHISQIYALINGFFFRQNINPNDPNAYVSCFKQLFISTHNFEFFSFLKDSKRINKAGSCRFYLIKRIEKDSSAIQGMPNFLKNHKSEYVYLFNLLFKYYIEGCSEQSENILLLPNAIRRFLEIYTLIKLPGSTEEVDFRLKYLFRDTTELKTLHHFSHFTSLEKLTKHDELLMNLPTAVKELFDFLEKDGMHFESLKSTVR